MPIQSRSQQSSVSLGPDGLSQSALAGGPTRVQAAARLAEVAPTSSLERVFLGLVTAASVSFCIAVVGMTIHDPDYFSRKLLASIERNDLDPIETGSTPTPEGEGKGPATVPSLPVPVLVRAHPPTPQDYQIVMIFEDEAILATSEELLRVKVGSILPGLGAIREITSTDDGGAIVAENATLKSVVK